MVETTLEIRFLAEDEACADIDCNVSGEAAKQAELVAFAHYAARILSLLGPDGSGQLVELLAKLGDDDSAEQIRVVPWEPRAGADRSFRALARFLNTASGPRMYFRLRERGFPPVTQGGGAHAAASVAVLFQALQERHVDDQPFLRSLGTAAALLARLGSAGSIQSDNEFDVSLAAADVAGRRGDGSPALAALDLECPACGNRAAEAGYEAKLWPSENAVIQRCSRCGAGVWQREGRRPRLLRADVWSAMEELRAELGRGAESTSVAAHELASRDGGGVLLEELKRAFAENGWPYSEVRGAPVLLSELSGALGRWRFYAQAVEEKDLILLYSICPLRAPEDRRVEVSHFLTRANYGLATGNFELDFDDGEIRYKTALQLQGEDVDSATVKSLVRLNGIAMETYLPGISSVIDGSPAQPAVEQIAVE
jgi:hypothetical protein